MLGLPGLIYRMIWRVSGRLSHFAGKFHLRFAITFVDFAPTSAILLMVLRRVPYQTIDFLPRKFQRFQPIFSSLCRSFPSLNFKLVLTQIPLSENTALQLHVYIREFWIYLWLLLWWLLLVQPGQCPCV